MSLILNNVEFQENMERKKQSIKVFKRVNKIFDRAIAFENKIEYKYTDPTYCNFWFNVTRMLEREFSIISLLKEELDRDDKFFKRPAMSSGDKIQMQFNAISQYLESLHTMYTKLSKVF
jgi:hypothetical protein